MSASNGAKIIKALLYVPYLLIAYLLQATVFTHLPVFGIMPLILPVAVVGVAVNEGSVAGGIFGIFAGILCDVALNEPVMSFVVMLPIVGLVVGILAETMLSGGFPSLVLCSFGALIFCAIFQMAPLLLYEGAGFGALIATMIKQTVYSIFFTIPVFYASRAISRTKRG